MTRFATLSIGATLALAVAAMAGVSSATAQGIEAPIETRRTPADVRAERSEKGIVITSSAARNPFTIEIVGRNIKPRSSARLGLDVDGRTILLSTVALQDKDAAAPQEELLNAFQAYDGEILGQQGWRVTDGSKEAFRFPSGEACLFWLLRAAAPERHLATAITRLGANVLILESATTDATSLSDLKQYLQATLLTLRRPQVAAPEAPPQPQTGDIPDEVKRASAGARMLERLIGNPYSTLLNVDHATEEDLQEIGSVQLSSKEMIAAAVSVVQRQQERTGGIGAMVFDGRASHAINLTGYIAQDDVVKYWDPWGKGSFLAAGSNAAGIEAIPSPTESRIWHVRRDQLQLVLYALTLEFNDLLALTEDMPLHTFRGLGDRLDEATKRDLFTFFHLEQATTVDRLGGGQAATFRPTAPKFHDAVAVTVTINKTGRLLDAQLRLDRDLIESKDLISRASAADIAKSFLAATTANDDAPYVTFLVNEITNAMNRGASVKGSAPSLRLPSQPTPGFLTFLGKEKQFDQRLTRSLLRMQNVEDSGKPMLVVSIETSRRVPVRK
jgi:hypothetical protein